MNAHEQQLADRIETILASHQHPLRVEVVQRETDVLAAVNGALPTGKAVGQINQAIGQATGYTSVATRTGTSRGREVSLIRLKMSNE
jgi:hypothetical protein